MTSNGEQSVLAIAVVLRLRMKLFYSPRYVIMRQTRFKQATI